MKILGITGGITITNMNNNNCIAGLTIEGLKLLDENHGSNSIIFIVSTVGQEPGRDHSHVQRLVERPAMREFSMKYLKSFGWLKMNVGPSAIDAPKWEVARYQHELVTQCVTPITCIVFVYVLNFCGRCRVFQLLLPTLVEGTRHCLELKAASLSNCFWGEDHVVHARLWPEVFGLLV